MSSLEKKPVSDNIIKEECMINQLPDSLLCEILFNLPTKDVVKTSLLCRRWRNLWQSVPGLDLVLNGSIDIAKFDFLTRFLDFNSDFCLQRVKLRYVGYGNNTRNVTSLNTVIKQKIQQLDVGSDTRNDRVTISPTIYTSCERLVSLKLLRVNLPKSPKLVYLPCLKMLELQRVEFVDSLAMEILISACPALETLTMDKMYGVRVLSQSLLRFCLTEHDDGVYRKTQVVMQTPKLKYLNLNAHFIERIIINDLSSIVKLNLVYLTNFGESFPNFLTLISCVKDLTISFDILRVNSKFSKSAESLPQFHNLSILRVKDMTLGSWEYLLIFLERCPNLKSLVMGFQYYNCGINFFDVPRCVLSSIEFVEVKARYLVDMDKIGRYFMKNSKVLKEFTLCLDHIKEDDHVILDKLCTFPRRSSTCEVVVRSRISGTYKPLSLVSCTDGFC